MTATWVPGVRAILEARRRRTEVLVAVLGDDEVHAQPVDYLSPVVWDVGHVGNFEELWLLREVGGRAPTDERLDHLYNAFENPRWTRGELPILSRDPALAYLRDVRAEVLGGLHHVASVDDPRVADGYVHRMIAQHESQHQETILQSLDLRPVVGGLGRAVPGHVAVAARPVDDTDRVLVPGGPFTMGTDRRRWTYDNERPAHTVHVSTFAVDRFPVTCRRFAAFVAAGGYDDATLWTSRGWAWRTDSGHRRPQGWRPDGDGGWLVRRLGRLVPLDPREPVQHVSWFEADAFARWVGGRLPTEAEWEKAAGWDPGTGRARRHPWGDAPPTPDRANVGLVRSGPVPVGSLPAGASAYGLEQCAGDVYEWTSSPFEGYPEFTAFPYPEYSQVFFGDQDYRVLRGSSWAIAASMARVTYRNWDHPHRRQVFAGLRVAWDVDQPGRLSMCRLAAHVGPPVALSTLLYDPPRSLEVLAHSPRELTHGVVNVDGTGVAWWPERDAPPLRYVTERTPWADPNLPTLAPRLVGAPIIAAVRSATPGIPMGAGNVAPFVGDGLAFAHNGWLGGFGRGVRGRLEALADDEVHHQTLAVSDSLVVFGLVRTARRAGAPLDEAVATALGQVADACRSAGEPATLNVVVSDGRALVATRCSVELAGNSLYTRAGATSWRLASEALDPDEDWQPVADGTLLLVGPDGVERRDLTP